MNHYGIAQWVDLARGLAPRNEQIAMQEHLAAGCSRCAQMVEFCDRLARTCSGMATRAPDFVVRRAREICQKRLPDHPQRTIRIPVELVFDSFLAPATAGLRGAWQRGWQALYRAGNCSLDIRIEPELHSPRASVIGQIFNHVQPETQLADVGVCLKSGRSVLVATCSNEHGEFQMEFQPQSRLQLCIFLDGGCKRIQVPIRRLTEDSPRRMNRSHPGRSQEKGLGRPKD
jgi:hypothetical protein